MKGKGRMTKDVFVSVTGLQSGEEETDQVETIYKGTYYKKEDKHYVVYEELMEGFEEPVRSMLKFREGALTVTKKGAVNVNMIFEEHKKNMCCYGTPYGEIMIGINTASVEMEEQEDSILVEADYELEANYQHLASCKICVKITEAEKGITIK